MAFGALSSGISALRSFSKGMEVIGNNIANVNTTSFKGSRIQYSETFNQVLRQSAPSASGDNGSNVPASQVGLGVQVQGITGVFEQGGLSSTGQPTDLAVSGEGFFLVKEGGAGSSYATRGGDFRIDDRGYLVTSEGLRVQGLSDGSIGFTVGVDADGKWKFTPDENSLKGTISPSKQGDIRLDFDKGKASVVTEDYDPGADGVGRNSIEYTNALLNVDASGVPVMGDFSDPTNVVYGHQVGAAKVSTVVAADGSESDQVTGVTGWHAFVTETVQLLSDLAGKSSEDNPITTAGLQEAVSSDFFYRMFPAEMDASRAAGETTIDGNAVENLFNGIRAGFATGTVEIDAERISAMNLLPTDLVGAQKMIKDVRSAETPDLARFAIDNDGTVRYFLDNGDSFARGQIGLIDFNDKTALIREGQNLYSGFGAAGLKGETTTNPSGLVVAGEAGMGAIQQYALELSNVDLTNEFANMITTQRGFQAGSRIITVSDDILQEVVNLKR